MLQTLALVGGREEGFFFLGPLFFFLLIGLTIWFFTRSARRHGPWMHQQGAGLAVLEERYAKGEIDREEYLAKREDLLPDHKKK